MPSQLLSLTLSPEIPSNRKRQSHHFICTHHFDIHTHLFTHPPCKMQVYLDSTRPRNHMLDLPISREHAGPTWICKRHISVSSSDDYESSHTFDMQRKIMQGSKLPSHPNIRKQANTDHTNLDIVNRHEENPRSPQARDATQKRTAAEPRVNRMGCKTAQGYAIKFIHERRPTGPDPRSEDRRG
jgi:hypothetical protein